MSANSEIRIPNSELRQRVDEFVGLFFYGTMLKGARDSHLTDSKIGYGGRGEDAFGAQLDLELASRMGQANNNNLTEAVLQQLSGKHNAIRLTSGSAGLAEPSATTVNAAGAAGAAGAAKAYAAEATRSNYLDLVH